MAPVSSHKFGFSVTHAPVGAYVDGFGTCALHKYANEEHIYCKHFKE